MDLCDIRAKQRRAAYEIQTHKSSRISPLLYRFLHCRPVFSSLYAANEIEEILGHRVVPYWKAYLLGIPTLFVYPMKSSACENISSEKSFSHAELYSKPKYKLSFPQIDRNRGVQIMADDLEFVFPLRLQHCHSAFHAIITGFQGNRFLIAEGPLNRII